MTCLTYIPYTSGEKLPSQGGFGTSIPKRLYSPSLPNPTLPAWNTRVLATTIGPDSLFEDRIYRTNQKGPPVTAALASPPGLMQMDGYRLFPCCYRSQGQLPCPLKTLQSHTASNKPHLSPGKASGLSSISAVSSFSPGNSSRTRAPPPFPPRGTWVPDQ